MTRTHAVPYYSQWESSALVPDFVAGRSAAEDPLWQKSGADSREEYAYWAPRTCGVACLRMALDHWGLHVPPSVPLARELEQAGAYVRDGDQLKGLIYQPAADYITTRWNIPATVDTDLTGETITAALTAGSLVILSVHKTIRTPAAAPEHTGGHLVLAVAADDDHLYINNPSGFPDHSQRYAPVPWSDLTRFSARRGIILGAPA